MRTSNLIARMKIAYSFLRHGKGICRIMTCEKCGAISIIPISKKPGKTEIKDEQHQIDCAYTEIVQCLRCGAVCEEIQLWNFDGNPEKIDKGLKPKEEET